MMDESGYLSALGSLKARHRSLVLPKGMQLANKEPAGFRQHSECFGEDELEILDMLQHKITSNQIEGFTFAGPTARDIGNFESNVCQFEFGLGLFDHAGREIEGVYAPADSGQQLSILACSATQFEN